MDEIKYIYKEQDFYNLFNKNIENKIKNTFKYIFFKFKKGIFIKISKNTLTHFIYFDNINFINNWSEIFKKNNNILTEYDVKKFITYSELYAKYWYIKTKYNLNCSLKQFIQKNKHKIDFNKFHLDVSKWYANNGLIRYDKQNIKEEKNILVFYDMFKELLKTRKIKDTFFFVNKRDFPLVSKNNKEPYYNLFGFNVEISDYKSYNLCNIFSMSTKYFFEDILLPTFEDWYRIRSKESIFFPPSFQNYNYNFEYTWENKITKFVFRGSSTGEGYDCITNKRINIATKNNKSKLLDVGITKLQLRPRIFNKKLFFINPDSCILSNKLNAEQQSKYKFIIHIEGNVSAFRLSIELSMKSCILIVDSEWKLWYSDKLKPYIHYIPIKKDLSDLEDKIKWCIENNEKCKQIANQSFIFSQEFLSKNSILNYLEKKLN